jgi:hypothetical protein
MPRKKAKINIYMIDNGRKTLLASSTMLSEVEVISIWNNSRCDYDLSYPYYSFEVVDSNDTLLLNKFIDKKSACDYIFKIHQTIISYL